MKKVIFYLLIVCLFSSCYASRHYVGDGGKYDGTDMTKYDVKKKQWFLLAGLIPLDDVTADQLAGDSKNYTVREVSSLGDMIITTITFGIASPRTIRISKAE